MRLVKNIAVAGFLFAVNSFAGGVGGGLLVIENPVRSMAATITGPLALGATLIGLVGGGIDWAKHHETTAMGGWMFRSAAIGGVVMGAGVLVPALYTAAGAVV